MGLKMKTTVALNIFSTIPVLAFLLVAVLSACVPGVTTMPEKCVKIVESDGRLAKLEIAPGEYLVAEIPLADVGQYIVMYFDSMFDGLYKVPSNPTLYDTCPLKP